jgi:uncharacterized protein
MTIDTHTHILDEGHWPNEWWDWVAADWARRAPDRTPAAIRDRIERGLIDPDGSRMVSQMDNAGVDYSVVLPVDWGPDFTAGQPIAAVVDKVLELSAAHQGRLIPFGGIDPRRPDATDLVTEWFDRGVRGLKLYPSCGWDPVSPDAMKVYELCAARQAPVLFHTGHPLPVLEAENSNPLLLKEVVQSFPTMPVWLGHAGAPVWWDEALEVAAAGPNVRLELSVWLWDDTGAEAELEVTRKVLDIGASLGFDRVIFGSDNVSGAKVRPPGFLDAVTAMYRRFPENAAKLGENISPDQMEMIMGRTAAADLALAG